jgi:FkbM family methyltransferase
LVNTLYDRLSWARKERFHARFAKLFREKTRHVQPGSWVVHFAGKRIVMPLTDNGLWLDWDAAVSLLGHEVEVKQTYESILLSRRRPDLFIDVGANYGGHSLLFLVHGVPTITIEPNIHCHRYCEQAASLNHVSCDIRPVALGGDECQVDLWFPATETWLGTVSSEVKGVLERQGAVDRLVVRQTTLDHLTRGGGLKPGLIKIDTEGHELAVLRGGVETLRRWKPLVIFESWPGDSRDQLFGFFGDLNYELCPLPLPPDKRPVPADAPTFRQGPGINWLAYPASAAEGGPLL